MNHLHRIAYCSRNRIPREHLTRELRAILEVARRNNPRLQVTGALLYSRGSFAQVLEGPLSSVEHIFESIQCDSRHGDVTVIESAPIEHRTFPGWSMAFAGHRALADVPEATAAFDQVFAGVHEGARHLLRLLRELVLDDGEWNTGPERPAGSMRGSSPVTERARVPALS